MQVTINIRQPRPSSGTRTPPVDQIILEEVDKTLANLSIARLRIFYPLVWPTNQRLPKEGAKTESTTFEESGLLLLVTTDEVELKGRC